MSGFRKPIEEGVTQGLRAAFAPGGGFSRALDSAFKPVFDELTALRRFKRRHQWHPIGDAPAWAKDGRPILVSERGEQFWAAWQAGDEGDEPYWDRDLEYGGHACAPDHWFPVPKPPLPATPNPDDGAHDASTKASTGETLND